jgi:hypothetical protein
MDDPDMFYRRTVAMFAAALSEEERTAMRERFRANHTPLKLQMQILAEMLEQRTSTP